MTYMLDTNSCIYIIKRKPPQVLDRLQEQAPGSVAVSSITVAELYDGVEKSQRAKQNRTALEHFLAPLEILDFDAAAGRESGRVRAALERAGTPIGAYDLLIAGHTLSLNVTLVSNNTREFSRISGLRLENWAER